MMKPTAYIINAARGPIIDEAALIEELKTGGIAGAGLDVFEQEPPAPDNPLLKMDNVIVSPHNAALSDGALRAMAMDSALGMGGIIPGVILSALMILYAIYYGVKNNIPRTKFNLRALGVASYHAIGAIFMPIIILGGIYSGVFTPTESAAVACAYGLIVGCFIYRELKLKDLVKTIRSAAGSSGMIMFIVSCAGVFALLMTREQIPAHAAEFIMSICSSRVTFLLLVNILLLIVGCFMDTTPAVLIICPILLPAVVSYGIDPVHFGIVVLLNMCIGMITPPLGINLYVAATLRQAKVGELVNRHLLTYMLCCLMNLMLITYFPQICMWLPNLMK